MELIKISRYYLPERNFEFEELSVREGLDPLLAVIARNRGIEDIDAIKSILSNDNPVFHDPFLFRDMGKAVNIVRDAAIMHKRIIVYGDYDVDGITATAIMVATLEELGAKVEFVIPDRFDEGYGLNLEFIESADLDCESLLITVDCGIASVNEVQAAKGKGATVIITDHHLPGDILPDADAIINPQLADSGYPEKTLCGAAVALKFAHALLEECPYEYIDLAALATVADVVPLTGENRHIVSAGLSSIRQGRRLALNRLLEAASVSYKDVDTQKLAFLIAPRINSLGRMGDASPAVRMLLSDDEAMVSAMVAQCVNDNKARQQIEKRILEEACSIVEAKNYHHAGAIIVGGEGWHQGVLGIVASRLVETYGVPAIVLSISDGVAKGSARSIAGYNIKSALDDCARCLRGYGGHAMAAGIELKTDMLEAFRMIFADHAGQHMRLHSAAPFRLDASLGLDCVNKDFIEKLQALEPTGTGFSRPIFHFAGLIATNIRKIGAKGEHLLLNLEDGRRTVQAVIFRYNGPELLERQKIEIIGMPEINEYKGYSSARVFIKEILIPVDENSHSVSLKTEALQGDFAGRLYPGQDFKLCADGNEFMLQDFDANCSLRINSAGNHSLGESFAGQSTGRRLRLCWVNRDDGKLFFIDNPAECIYRGGSGFSKPLIYKGLALEAADALIRTSARSTVIVCRDNSDFSSCFARLQDVKDELPILVMTQEEKDRYMPRFMALQASGRRYVMLVSNKLLEAKLLNPAWLASGLQIFFNSDEEYVDSLEEKIYYSTVPLTDRRFTCGS